MQTWNEKRLRIGKIHIMNLFLILSMKKQPSVLLFKYLNIYMVKKIDSIRNVLFSACLHRTVTSDFQMPRNSTLMTSKFWYDANLEFIILDVTEESSYWQVLITQAKSWLFYFKAYWTNWLFGSIHPTAQRCYLTSLNGWYFLFKVTSFIILHYTK